MVTKATAEERALHGSRLCTSDGRSSYYRGMVAAVSGACIGRNPSRPLWVSRLVPFRRGEAQPDWCLEVGRHLDWKTMASSFQRVRRGDVEALEQCAHILSRLRVPLLRSRVRELATAMGSALRGAALADIRFEPVLGSQEAQEAPGMRYEVVHLCRSRRSVDWLLARSGV